MALEDALNELPDKPIPIDIEGKKHIIQRTVWWEIPPDLVRLLIAVGQRERLDVEAKAAHCKVQHQNDGTIRIVWDPNA